MSQTGDIDLSQTGDIDLSQTGEIDLSQTGDTYDSGSLDQLMRTLPIKGL